MAAMLKIKPFSILKFSLCCCAVGWVAPIWAAACCGGSIAAPAMIASDDKAQLSVSLSRTEITDDVYPDRTWRRRQTPETAQIWNFEGAHIFADRWQAGGSVPVVKRVRGDQSSQGLGDITASVGYEYLPDWDYNPVRPKGLGFLQLIAPTGQSIYEAENIYQLDSRGRGFWAVGGGSLLTKTWGSWDAVTLLGVHRSFSKDYSNTQSNGTLIPGWGGVLSAGGGYSWRSLRGGVNVGWNYEDPIEVRGSVSTQGSAQRFATVTASLSHSPNEAWSATLSYQDQSLIGRPVNTSLNRGLQFQIQRRFSR